jgi:hypothetical protein
VYQEQSGRFAALAQCNGSRKHVYAYAPRRPTGWRGRQVSNRHDISFLGSRLTDMPGSGAAIACRSRIMENLKKPLNVAINHYLFLKV